jgi:hypothetical protein
MIGFTTSGSFKNTEEFLNRMNSGDIFSSLDKYGQRGVDALSNATPEDTGETANSWRYKVTHKNGEHAIHFYNTHVEDGKPIAILIQYGHGTGTGGFVQGRDFINPAVRPIFDQILDEVWKQVIK